MTTLLSKIIPKRKYNGIDDIEDVTNTNYMVPNKKNKINSDKLRQSLHLILTKFNIYLKQNLRSILCISKMKFKNDDNIYIKFDRIFISARYRPFDLCKKYLINKFVTILKNCNCDFFNIYGMMSFEGNSMNICSISAKKLFVNRLASYKLNKRIKGNNKIELFINKDNISDHIADVFYELRDKTEIKYDFKKWADQLVDLSIGKVEKNDQFNTFNSSNISFTPVKSVNWANYGNDLSVRYDRDKFERDYKIRYPDKIHPDDALLIDSNNKSDKFDIHDPKYQLFKSKDININNDQDHKDIHDNNKKINTINQYIMFVRKQNNYHVINNDNNHLRYNL